MWLSIFNLLFSNTYKVHVYEFASDQQSVTRMQILACDTKAVAFTKATDAIADLEERQEKLHAYCVIVKKGWSQVWRTDWAISSDVEEALFAD